MNDLYYPKEIKIHDVYYDLIFIHVVTIVIEHLVISLQFT